MAALGSHCIIISIPNVTDLPEIMLELLHPNSNNIVFLTSPNLVTP
jgi:hypothetical protein